MWHPPGAREVVELRSLPEQVEHPPEPLRIASLWARIGDGEQTAEWLERAYQERSMALPGPFGSLTLAPGLGPA